jgi:hypothetical protein
MQAVENAESRGPFASRLTGDSYTPVKNSRRGSPESVRVGTMDVAGSAATEGGVVQRREVPPPRRYFERLRDFLARAAPMAVFTSCSSSGGGSTAGIPSVSIHSSRPQPVVW